MSLDAPADRDASADRRPCLPVVAAALAIVAFVCAFFAHGFAILVALVAAVLGVLALRRLRSGRIKGGGFAMFAVCGGLVALVVAVAAAPGSGQSFQQGVQAGYESPAPTTVAPTPAPVAIPAAVVPTATTQPPELTDTTTADTGSSDDSGNSGGPVDLPYVPHPHVHACVGGKHVHVCT